MDQAIQHPERFDPDDGSDGLINSEHRARYRWVSQVVAGKDVLDAGCGVGYGVEILASAGARAVTGIDLDPAAVATAAERFGAHAEAFLQGDVRELPAADASFDVVVCFETIEHVEDGARALAEFRRVLRPGGVLVVSSPNPDAYLAGNEHHVHEFRPLELVAAVGEHFTEVVSYRQRAWLASMIEAGEGLEADASRPEVFRASASEANDEVYSMAVASNEPLPELTGVLALGGAFDVRWWSEQLDNSKGELAQALAREATANARLSETATALLNANQALAQIPLYQHRLASLEEQHGELADRYHAILDSNTWRWAGRLQRLRRLGRS
jgi:2-polyprenyl-3-methyl-5-hydroxy-6-metoxy-1,4-benzoquinol methylase